MNFFSFIYWGDTSVTSPDEPYEYLSTIDERRRECSKYAFFRDGTYAFCNDDIEVGGEISPQGDVPYDREKDLVDEEELWLREISYQEYSTLLFNKMQKFKLRTLS